MKFETNVICKGIFYPAGTEVPVGKVQKVDLTDDVPEGALDENVDGSTNVYDESGNKIGTVSKEEVEKIEAKASEVLKEQTKRAKTSKKA